MPNNNYSEEDVENALKHHREQGILLRKCAFKFNVQNPTLIDRNTKHKTRAFIQKWQTFVTVVA